MGQAFQPAVNSVVKSAGWKACPTQETQGRTLKSQALGVRGGLLQKVPPRQLFLMLLRLATASSEPISERRMKDLEPTDWIERHFEVHDGFPRLDWAVIERHIEEKVDEPRHYDAWNMVAEEWLGKIIETLGGDYWLGVTPNFLVVTSESERYAENLGLFLENALKTILTSLAGIASKQRNGKCAVILFETTDQYYTYISYFYPKKGRFASSGGVFIHKGYGHFALPQGEMSRAESTVAHELTHVCLSRLQIPLWLNEGIAQKCELAVLNKDPIMQFRDIRDLDEMMKRHRRFWGKREIQQFWSGDSFARPDVGNELSYHLAQLAVGALSHDHKMFKRFALSAHYRDGGEAAALEVFGGSLGGLMEQFLGPGDWAPRSIRRPRNDQALGGFQRSFYCSARAHVWKHDTRI